MTVRTELNVANPNTLPENCNRAVLGDGLALLPRTEIITVAAATDIGTLPATAKAKAILSCYVTDPTAVNYCTVALTDAAPAAGEVAINPLGDIVFNAADNVLECELVYIPVEGELVTETIPVAATGTGTLNNGRSASQLVSATLIAPAATPGDKVVEARGTAVGAVGAAGVCVDFSGVLINFAAAEAAAACTALVSYWALPGVGTGTQLSIGDRLEAADSNDAGI